MLLAHDSVSLFCDIAHSIYPILTSIWPWFASGGEIDFAAHSSTADQLRRSHSQEMDIL
jgi:hypothetical protein